MPTTSSSSQIPSATVNTSSFYDLAQLPTFKSVVPVPTQTPPISLVLLLDEQRKKRELNNLLEGKKQLNEMTDLSGNIYNFVENSKGEVDVVIEYR
jgi:hypothetical protein